MEQDLLKNNEELAQKNKRLLDKHKILAVDVMGSIGSGKTSLIKNLISQLKESHCIGVIAGDLTTTIDADRIKDEGVEVIQVDTGKECHLDANLIRKALKKFSLKTLNLLFIENVGNLICPADFPLGSHKRIVVISVTESPWMVMKHPYIFLEAGLAVINKIDLARAMEVSPQGLAKDIHKINPAVKVVQVSCIRSEGVEKIIEALPMNGKAKGN